MRALRGAWLAILVLAVAPASAQEATEGTGERSKDAAAEREASPPVVDDRAPLPDPCEGEAPPDTCKERSQAAPPAAPLDDERALTAPEESSEPAPLSADIPADAVSAEPPEPAAATTSEPREEVAGAERDAAVPSADPRAHDEDGVGSDAAPPGIGDAEREGLGFGGVPALNYDADNGFGFGVVASLYWYEKGVDPYRYSLTFMIFATSKLVQDHQIRFDAVDVLDLPLRLTFRGGYFQSVTQNFCGFGNSVTCDPRLAQREAARLGLTGDDEATFVRRYYLMRLVRPYAQLLARWRLIDEPTKLEVMAGYRGHLMIPGDPWADDDGDGSADLAFQPYAGSLYAKTFPRGEPGFASLLSVGLMLDDRDQEASPTRGYWIEGSVRVSSTLLGSSWNYVGGNLTLRTYLPLVRGPRNVVLAQRLILDATAGDVPVDEMVRVGGSWDFTALGGNPMGRGIRSQRYIGRIKVLDQLELRADLAEHELFGQRFRWGVAGLLDAGWIGVDWTDVGGDPLRVNFGVGGGVRLAWNENFVIRLDVAGSPEERFSPLVYIDIGNTF